MRLHLHMTIGLVALAFQHQSRCGEVISSWGFTVTLTGSIICRRQKTPRYVGCEGHWLSTRVLAEVCRSLLERILRVAGNLRNSGGDVGVAGRRNDFVERSKRFDKAFAINTQLPKP